jgi:nitrite reductase (NADH) small subunit
MNSRRSVRRQLPERHYDVARRWHRCERAPAWRARRPHRGGPLSQGIVHGERVTCPLHDWVIDLASGRATGVDVGCTATFAVRDVADRLQIELPEAVTAEAFDALDSQVDACAQSRTA